MPITGSSPLMSRIVQDELAWRRPAALMEEMSAPTNVIASRWTDSSGGVRHVSSTIRADYHTIAIALRRATIALRVSDCVIYEGAINPGTIQVSSQGPPVDAILGSPCDFLHIHVPNSLLLACCASGGVFAHETQI